MARIKIKDLSQDMIVSSQDMAKIKGGAMYHNALYKNALWSNALFANALYGNSLTMNTSYSNTEKLQSLYYVDSSDDD